MFRLLTGHYQVVHPMKRVEGCTIYNVTSLLYSPQPFSLDVQPDDGLLEAEICSCWLLLSSAIYIYIYIYIVVFWLYASAVYFVIWLTQRGCRTSKSLPKFRNNLMVPSSGTKTGPICCSEISVRIYHYTTCNNSEECRSHPNRGGNLKPP